MTTVQKRSWQMVCEDVATAVGYWLMERLQQHKCDRSSIGGGAEMELAVMVVKAVAHKAPAVSRLCKWQQPVVEGTWCRTEVVARCYGGGGNTTSGGIKK